MSKKKKMAIICSTDYLSWPMGGMMSFIVDILPYLGKYFDIDLWGVSLSKKQCYTTIAISDKNYSFHSICTAITGRRKIIPNILRVIMGIETKLRHIFHGGYDVLYFHGLPLEIPFLFRKKEGIKIVSHIHGIINPFSASDNSVIGKAILAFIYKRLRYLVAKKSDLVFVASDNNAYNNFVSTFSPTDRPKIKKIHNFANPTIFLPMDKSGVRYEMNLPNDIVLLIYTGRLSPQKDPLLLLKVFKEVKSLSKDMVKLVIVGDGPLFSTIEQLVFSSKLENDVKLVGARSRNEVAKWLNAADVFVFTSLGEGSPLSLIEALMCGLPIVATNVSGLDDIVIDGHTGFIVKSRSPTEIAVKVLDAIKNIAKMRNGCIEHSKKFRPQTAADMIARNILAL